MNIAIYGGSFNPPHLGHLNVVLHMLNNHPEIDKIEVIPCFQQTGKKLLNFHARMKMCEMVFGDLPKVTVSAREYNLGGESLTVNTVKDINPYGDYDNVFLIVGQDTADKIPSWEGGEELLRLVKLRIAPRTNISSTEIREESRMGKWSSKTPKSVMQYITNNRLYGYGSGL